MIISFIIPGTPASKGSWKVFGRKNPVAGKRNHFLVNDSKKSRPWVALAVPIITQALVDFEETHPQAGRWIAPPALPWDKSAEYAVTFSFQFTRPKSHFTKPCKKRPVAALKPNMPTTVRVKPDIDKLLRISFDVMTGLVFDDDCQITQCLARKVYADTAGVYVTVTAL